MTDQAMEWSNLELCQAVFEALPYPKPSGINALNQTAVGFHWNGEAFRVISQKLSTVCSVHCERLLADADKPDLTSALIARMIHIWLTGDRQPVPDERIEAVDESFTGPTHDDPRVKAEELIAGFMETLDRLMEEGTEGDQPESQPKPQVEQPPQGHKIQLTVNTDKPAFLVIFQNDPHAVDFVKNLTEVRPGVEVHRIV